MSSTIVVPKGYAHLPEVLLSCIDATSSPALLTRVLLFCPQHLCWCGKLFLLAEHERNLGSNTHKVSSPLLRYCRVLRVSCSLCWKGGGRSLERSYDVQLYSTCPPEHRWDRTFNFGLVIRPSNLLLLWLMIGPNRTSITAIKYPVHAAVACGLWSFSRILYTIGYITGEPKKRTRGHVGYLSVIGEESC